MIVIESFGDFLKKQERGYFQSDVLRKIRAVKREVGIDLNMETGPWVAGGSVLRFVQGQHLGYSDIDIFFRDPAEFSKVSHSLDKVSDSEELKLYRENKERWFVVRDPYAPQPDAKRIYRTAKAYTYNLEKSTVQIIRNRYYESVSHLLGDFDFTVCMFATDGNEIAYYPQALEDAKNWNLRIHRVHRESVLIRRFYKYLANGYTPLPGETRLLHEIVREDPMEYASPSNYKPTSGSY